MERRWCGLLAIVLAATGATSAWASAGELRIEPCGEVLEITFERGDQVHAGSWCGTQTGTVLSEAQTYERLHIRLRRTRDAARYDVDIGPDGTEISWRGAGVPADGTAVALDATGTDAEPARLTLKRDPEGARLLFFRVFNQPLEKALRAVLAVSGRQLTGLKPTGPNITLNFEALPADTALQLIYGETDGVLRHAANGDIRAVRTRAGPEVAALLAQYEPLTSDATEANEPERLHLLEAIRALVRVRDARDEPVDARLQLEHLAELYVYDKRLADRAELRRELLAQTLRFDARADNPYLAMARARLAHALQQAGAAGDEDATLLKLAEPLLRQHRGEFETEALREAALALRQRGRTETAIELLEAAFERLERDVEDLQDQADLTWILGAEALSLPLLALYRDNDRTAPAAHLLAQWQRRHASVDWPSHMAAQSVIKKALLDGRWQQAARDSELLIARLPPLPKTETWQLANLYNDARAAHLANGEYAHAAAVQGLLLRLALARTGRSGPAALLRQLEREQRQLDALARAAGQSVPERPWFTRYRQPDAPGGPDRSGDRIDRYFLGLDAQVRVLVGEAVFASGKEAPPAAVRHMVVAHLLPLVCLLDSERQAESHGRLLLEQQRADGADAATLRRSAQLLADLLELGRRATQELEAPQ